MRISIANFSHRSLPVPFGLSSF